MMTPGDLAAGLARLDLDAIANAALAAAAGDMADLVRALLSQEPGAPHDAPWQRTGTLETSINASADGPEALIGSADPVAVWQEQGTPRIPPRPFLGPVAAQSGAAAAEAVGAAVAAAIGGV
jgi:hypothetical protein